MGAYEVVAEFERRVAEFAGAPHGIAVDCCTSAIFLSLQWERSLGEETFTAIPARTYVSVPMAALHAGYRVRLDGIPWHGSYGLGHRVIDGAKRFRRGMYHQGALHCLSFHAKKHLNIGRGGMILTDDAEAVAWLRRARYDGREGKPYDQERVTQMGWHCYMTPDVAARGLMLLDVIPDNLPDQVEDYPDLRLMPVFQNHPQVTCA